MCLYIIRVQAQVVADCLIVYNYVYFTYHYIYSIRYFQLVYIILCVLAICVAELGALVSQL